jgi:cytidylate kinase
MKMTPRSIEKIVEEQVQRWRLFKPGKLKENQTVPVITLSREPGSGGIVIAQMLAERLEMDLFHQDVINKIAQSSDVSAMLIETLDERGLSVLEDWISSMVHDRHLWPDEYLQHLMKVIGTIGQHGRAVVVGRGANFILLPDKRFSVRVTAPLELRTQNVARQFGIDYEEAKRRVIRTEANRKSFVRKYFYADINDPLNYDMVINTAGMSMEQAVNAICGVLDA